jgi:hypothetical protein
MAPFAAAMIVFSSAIPQGVSVTGTAIDALLSAAVAWCDMLAISRLPAPLDRFWRRALALNLLFWAPLGGFVFARTIQIGGTADAGLAAGFFAYSVMFIGTLLYMRWLWPRVDPKRQGREESGGVSD